MRHFFLLGVFSLTLLSSALLLFAVQPMVGKILLPWLGGTPAVWNTCMVFFQALLLAGYAYAHFLSSRVELKKQWLVHAVVLLVALVPLYFLRFDAGRIAQYYNPPEESSPIVWLLAVLLASAGLPFFAVAATAPLLQRWFSRTGHPDAKDPYFLYGASNLGSMLALLAYPFLIEPIYGVNQQTFFWLVGFAIMGGMILLSGALAIASPAETGSGPPVSEKPQAAASSSTIVTSPIRPAAGSTISLAAAERSERPVNAAASAAQEAPKAPEAPAPGLFDFTGWAVLGMIPSSLMLGATTFITTDIAAIPLLWILPLTLYLLSFILVFSRIPLWLSLAITLGVGSYFLYGYNGAIDFKDFYDQRDVVGFFKVLYKQTRLAPFASWSFLAFILGTVIASRSFMAQHTLMVLLLPLAIMAVTFRYAVRTYLDLTEVEHISLHLFLLFTVSMVCHGELARTRPAPDHLTYFYLAMSTGGVLGGIFNTMVAPLLFKQVIEYPLMAVMACLMIPGVSFGVYRSRNWAIPMKGLEYLAQGAVFVFGLLLGCALMLIHFLPYSSGKKWFDEQPSWVRNLSPVETFIYQLDDDSHVLYRERNFFGTFRIVEDQNNDEGWTFHKFLHGTTDHGMQCYEPAQNRRKTLGYFHHRNAIGQIFETMRERAKEKDRPLKVGVMGLGTGTLAAYMEPGWSLDLYEIDPAVVQVATKNRELFTFVPDAIDRGVQVQVELGDARRKIGKAEDGKYDLIFMDAFTSDAVPVHLLTREAFELYKTKLQPDGIVVINIANRYLNFEGVLGNMAQATGMSAMIQGGDPIKDDFKYGTNWVVMAKSRAAFGSLPMKANEFQDSTGEKWNEYWIDLLPRDFAESKVWSDDYSNLPSILK